MTLMFNRLSILALSAAVFFALPQFADARGHRAAGGGPLTGRVVSAGDRPAGGARVIIKGSRMGAKEIDRSHRTNRRGHFKFRHLPPARYAITVMKPGFYPRTVFTGTERHKGLVIHLQGPAHAESIGVGAHHRRHALRVVGPQLKTVTPLHLPHINGHGVHEPEHKEKPVNGPVTPKAPGHSGGPAGKKR